MAFFSRVRDSSQGGLFGGVLFDVWGQRGYYAVEVVGESFHAKELRALFPSRVDSAGHELTVPVVVTHDARNRHDANAVEVRAATGALGHLSREDAKCYAPVVAALQTQGLTAATTSRVWGYYGYSESGKEEFIASVRVDLPEPHMLVPANLPPSGAHTVLPVGTAIQVTGEERRMDALAPFLNTSGECWAYATVHELVDQSGRTPKTLAEVRLDNHSVGRLTPKMSGELLPVVNYLAARGQKTGVRAIVKGNALKAEVVLYTVKASELPAAWFDQNSRSADGAATVGLVGSTDRTAQETSAVEDRAPHVSADQGGAQVLPPANWYPDPQRVARLRYWDGTSWTQHTAR